jgi:uncharacterized glyoxalase superfamily protein PhnB
MATRKPTRSRSPRASGAKTRKAPASRPGTAKSSRKSSSRPARKPKTRRSPETLRLRSVTPAFTVNDLHRSLAFYTEVLGFVVKERWTDGSVLRGVMLVAGACELGLSQDNWAKGRDRKKGEGVRIWCDTAQDVDALAARVKAAGHALTEAPQDRWGGRNFSLDDPDGFHITVHRSS